MAFPAEPRKDFVGKARLDLDPKGADSRAQRGGMAKDRRDRMPAMFRRETNIGCCGRRAYGADIIDGL
jgi:hypothetical protein